MVFTPITPVLIIRNISKSDVNILGVKIRPGQQKDIYQELEYDENGSLTTTVLKELETPNGKIYRLWKVLDVIRIIECVNPTHFGSGLVPESITASNDFFEGAFLGYEGGEFKWLSGGGGGGVSAVTASSPLASSGGTTPNITIGGGDLGQVLTSGGPGVDPTWTTISSDFTYDQEVFVAKNGSDVTGTGSVLNPFASIGDAMASIADASPTKRYAVRVSAGEYTESSALNIKPNVFVVGSIQDGVRVTAPSFGLDASFTGGADNRSGLSSLITVGAHNYNFGTVTSTAGKLYFRDVTFTYVSSSADAAVTITGTNNVNQAQFDSCTFFGTITFSGVNVGAFTNNKCFTSIVLNQHSSVATVLNAAGGFADSLTATASVNNFGRRCSVFARSMKFDGTVTVDGPSAYFDYTVSSLPPAGATVLNGGNLVKADYRDFTLPEFTGANRQLSNLEFPTAVNYPIIPASTNATNNGDWDKQWFFSFSYVYLSSGTDLYIGSAGPEAVPDSAGRSVYLQPDQYGLQPNVAGGLLDMRTSSSFGAVSSGNVVVTTGDTTATVTVSSPGGVNTTTDVITTSVLIPTQQQVRFATSDTLPAPLVAGTDYWTITLTESTTIGTGSNGVSLPQATINVASTAAFPGAGTLSVTTSDGVQIVTYTGKTATAFTGCSGGSGTMSTGGAVSQTFTRLAESLANAIANTYIDLTTQGAGTQSISSPVGDSGDVAITTGTSVDGNSGDITVTTGTPSGTGTRGIISLDGRHIDANSAKIVNIADGTASGDAVNLGQLSAMPALGASQKIFWLVEGGKYASLASAYAAASEGDIILIGPKASGTWGDVTLSENKIMSFVGLNGVNGKQVKIGAVTFSPTTAGMNINRNEHFFSNLMITGSFASQAVLFSGSGAGRMRFSGCIIDNSSSSGDGVVNSNTFSTGTVSSLWLDNTTVSVNTTTGAAVRQSSGYTFIKNRSDISGGASAVVLTGGTIEFYDSSVEINGTGSVVSVSATLPAVASFLVGYSTIKNNTTNGSGVSLTGNGAVLGAGNMTFAIATGTGYCVSGNGTYLYGPNTYSNTLATPYNVNVQSTLTALPVTTTFTLTP